MLRKVNNFLLRMQHNVPCVVSRNEMYSWQQYHGLRMLLGMVVTETR